MIIITIITIIQVDLVCFDGFAVTGMAACELRRRRAWPAEQEGGTEGPTVVREEGGGGCEVRFPAPGNAGGVSGEALSDTSFNVVEGLP